ncbi:hypothetical protein Ddye_023183 [Dipteronia dyeriana]|uniref:Uncharacterized protein n=1 Tax=Dipteronia dyeriana TaxID=168575 RepID=A0AAD9TSG7_9ROSI|nr:hypothetical protein Ddye_023183 [Dipteronia dyeriana]
MFFLMETKVYNFVIENIHVKTGYYGKFMVNSVGRSGGLCLLWSSYVDVSLVSYSNFHIDVDIVSHKDIRWRFTGFYGDFNEILMDSEKSGGIQRPQNLMENFRSALNDCGLQDIGFVGSTFTWCNKRDGEDMIQERLDRVVCDCQWDKHEELKMLSTNVTTGSWKKIREVENKLDVLLDKEELYWKQRSCECWLKGGDRNSKYFHFRASSRHTRNKINGIFDVVGQCDIDQDSIGSVIMDHFGKIFQSKYPFQNDMDLMLRCVQPCLPEENKTFLDANFSSKEIRAAVFDLHPTKAPGPDGLPTVFFPKILVGGW